MSWNCCAHRHNILFFIQHCFHFLVPCLTLLTGWKVVWCIIYAAFHLYWLMASFSVNHSIEFCEKECEKFCCWYDWSAFTCKQMLETEIRTNGYLRSFQILQRSNGSQMLVSNWQSDKHSFLVWLEKKSTLSITIKKVLFFFWKWFSLTACGPQPHATDAHVRLLHDLTRVLPDCPSLAQIQKCYIRTPSSP